jgi:chlorite dismutase
MNEHMKLGKLYPEIKQLLLYSFGLQDHEFVVAYEMNSLTKFSDLVRDLRSTEARRHTSLDTPIIVGLYQTKESFIR